MKFHQRVRDENGWELISEEVAFENPYLRVQPTHVRTPTRPDGVHWTVAHRKGAVAIAPLTVSGKFILVRQERVPIRQTIWEFPAGQIDSNELHDDAVIRATALRELREEAACELGPAGELVPLGIFFSSPGFTDEHSHLFLARNVIRSDGGFELDENEAISEAREFTPGELRGMVVSGEIFDANTLACFARMAALGLI